MLLYDVLLKLVMVGDSGVGKTSLVRRFVDDSYMNVHLTTIGVDFAILTMEHKETGKVVKIQVWDTAGQERFRSIASSYFRSADGIMMVYDRTNRDTLRSVEDTWLPEARALIKSSCVVGLVGNKSDLPASPGSEEDAVLLAKQFSLATVPNTSAKTGKAVNDGFLQFCEMMVRAKLGPFKGGDAAPALGRNNPIIRVRQAQISTKGGIDLRRPDKDGARSAWWRRLFCNLW